VRNKGPLRHWERGDLLVTLFGIIIIYSSLNLCGKSWLACAIGQQACRQGLSVKYLRVAKLIEELRIAHADGSYRAVLSLLARNELLILDDFGIDQLSQQDQRDLLEIVEDRHKLKSTLITSQLAVKHWYEYMVNQLLQMLLWIVY
jgi:DNA replication protein DnaC